MFHTLAAKQTEAQNIFPFVSVADQGLNSPGFADRRETHTQTDDVLGAITASVRLKRYYQGALIRLNIHINRLERFNSLISKKVNSTSKSKLDFAPMPLLGSAQQLNR